MKKIITLSLTLVALAAFTKASAQGTPAATQTKAQAHQGPTKKARKASAPASSATTTTESKPDEKAGGGAPVNTRMAINEQGIPSDKGKTTTTAAPAKAGTTTGTTTTTTPAVSPK